MGYTYEEFRETVFTERGTKLLLKIRDNADKLLTESGAFTLWNAIKNVSGDTWEMLACIDYLVEIGFLREIPNPKRNSAQSRVFTEPTGRTS